ncbi:hypothetical protein [Microbacterium foliorum]|uniref:hypothetical protein n=1 Tax=Microbacterium foliorum TaxID=104336 RepID=UPI0028D88F87|nr:hypothetical protein [Microbacterium foliorum]
MTALDARVRQGFSAAGIPVELTDELLEAFAEAKRRYYRDDLRPSEIEGARFSEAAFRILQWVTVGAYTPLGKTLPSVDKLMDSLVNTVGSDSVRIHIPRTLRLIYDVRNKRDVAHLGDGIDPNQQDAALVLNNMDWVLAELVRLHHNVSADEAHGIIVDLVSKDVPLIQEFDGFPRVLKQLGASDHMLVLLYWRGSDGASFDELRAWARPAMRANLGRTLRGLDGRDLLHFDGSKYRLTRPGENAVERRKLLEPT